MRTLRIVIALTGLGLAYSTTTLGGSFDTGIILGDPAGLSIKGWINDVHAYDVAISSSSGRRDKRYIHGDYLRHDYTLINISGGDLPVYYGIGARVLDQDNKKTEAGLRIPVGLDYLSNRYPVSVFAEIAPRLDLTPDTDFKIDAAVGIRYRFMYNTPGRNSR